MRPSHRSSRCPRCLRIATLIIGMMTATPSGPALAAQGSLAITIEGADVVEVEALRQVMGRPPSGSRRARESWLEAATGRIVALYKERGYSIARAWQRYDPKTGRGVVYVDEGQLDDIQLLGGGLPARLWLRNDLHLPSLVFHEPTVLAAIEQLKARRGFLNVSFTLRDSDELLLTGLGVISHTRLLEVRAVADEEQGWGGELDMDPRWGPTVTARYTDREGFGARDGYALHMDAALPYRRYPHEREAAMVWVHGGAALTWQHRFPSSEWSTGTHAQASLSRDARTDVGWDTVVALAFQGYGRVTWTDHEAMRVVFDGGVAHYTIVDDYTVDGSQGAPYRAQTRLEARGLMTLYSGISGDRLHPRNSVDVGLSLGWDTSRRTFITRLNIQADATIGLGPFALRLRGRGDALFGAANFWDELPAANPQQRVFFESRYWYKRGLQASADLYYGMGDARVGVFHDLTFFQDKNRGDKISILNAFGPSAEAIVLRLISLRVDYGFGFSPSGFGHNLYFKLSTVF